MSLIDLPPSIDLESVTKPLVEWRENCIKQIEPPFFCDPTDEILPKYNSLPSIQISSISTSQGIPVSTTTTTSGNIMGSNTSTTTTL